MKKNEVIYNFAKLIITAFLTYTIYKCFMSCYNPLLEVPFMWKGILLVVVTFVALYILFTGVYDAFDLRFSRVSELAFSQILSVLMSDGIMYLIIFFILKKIPNILPALVTLAIQVVVIALWSSAAKKSYFKCSKALKTIEIYDEDIGLSEMLKSKGLNDSFAVSERISISNNEMPLIPEGTQVILLNVNNSDLRNRILELCVEREITAFVIPVVGDMFIRGAENSHLLHLPVVRFGKFKPEFYYSVIKRFFDIILSFAGLAILSPILLITSLAVKLCDGGPVFYKQTRLTKDGKEFKILKFRSMRVDAEKNGIQLSTGEKDDRVTPVGKVIRKVRLDELPQLFNILSGKMSFVGPRPERPEIAAEYCKEYPEFALRLQTKAGLTGYAQIYGKYNTGAYDKLRMDLMYISNCGIVEDMKLIFATVKILFSPESTEGIEEGKKNAIGR